MKSLTIEALYSSIDDIIRDNHEEIEDYLFESTDSSMSVEEVVGHLIPRYFSLAVKLSVHLTLEILQSQGTFEIDEREIAKIYLKHLSFEKED